MALVADVRGELLLIGIAMLKRKISPGERAVWSQRLAPPFLSLTFIGIWESVCARVDWITEAMQVSLVLMRIDCAFKRRQHVSGKTIGYLAGVQDSWKSCLCEWVFLYSWIGQSCKST
jgi:hypothetical protein